MSARKRSGRWWAAILAVPVLIFGFLRVQHGIEAHRDGTAAQSWPTTIGRITDRWIDERTVRDGRQSRPDDTPRVRYDSAGGGRSCSGTRIGAGHEGFENMGRAGGKLLRYDPDHPERSLLEPGWSWGDSYGRLLTGAAFLGCGLMLVAVSIPDIRARAPALRRKLRR